MKTKAEWKGKKVATPASAGMTLIEVLVVIAIMGILISLLLVGVQAARETSRRMTCQSHLRQIALAAHHYADSHRMFPAGSVRGYSPHVAILPFIEEQALYARIDFLESHEPGANLIRQESVAIYLCPSDGAPRTFFLGEQLAGTNYAGNAGGWYNSVGFSGAFRYWDEQYVGGGLPIRPADFVDGLSTTALFAEIMRADGTMARMRVNWNTPFGFATVADLPAFASLCRGLSKDPAASGWNGTPIRRGTPWTQGNCAITLYNHVLTPNHPTCLNESNLTSALTTAASLHPGGVSLAYADGHVNFVADEIDDRTWQAIGSRNGQDP
jgi:prepilin-type N-terminal cleavage/methylation domain-containing protein/prepilin-type processing-associated H-X9-DG protein